MAHSQVIELSAIPKCNKKLTGSQPYAALTYLSTVGRRGCKITKNLHVSNAVRCLYVTYVRP